MSKKLAIAMFGQKRLSREGGVEIVVKELCTRMAQQGCQVTCYNRSGHHVSGAEYDDAGKTEDRRSLHGCRRCLGKELLLPSMALIGSARNGNQDLVLSLSTKAKKMLRNMRTRSLF